MLDILLYMGNQFGEHCKVQDDHFGIAWIVKDGGCLWLQPHGNGCSPAKVEPQKTIFVIRPAPEYRSASDIASVWVEALYQGRLWVVNYNVLNYRAEPLP